MSCMICYELQGALESAKKGAASAPPCGLSVAAQRNRDSQTIERVSMLEHKIVRHKRLSQCRP